jgi:hypothetical protein
MKKVLTVLVTCFMTCVQQPVFAGDRVELFSHLLKPIDRSMLKTMEQKGASLTIESLDSLTSAIAGGVLCFKLHLNIAVTAFDRSGTPIPFYGMGPGISFQREIAVKGLNKTTLEINAGWMTFLNGNGPVLTVGAFDGYCIGGALNVKDKHWYALATYTGGFLTYGKN